MKILFLVVLVSLTSASSFASGGMKCRFDDKGISFNLNGPTYESAEMYDWNGKTNIELDFAIETPYSFFAGIRINGKYQEIKVSDITKGSEYRNFSGTIEYDKHKVKLITCEQE